MPELESSLPSTQSTFPEAVPESELSKHRGRWVAFSADGGRIIASAVTLAELEAQLRALGQDPEEVLLECLPTGDFVVSGSELS
jgi:hypothetical protein